MHIIPSEGYPLNKESLILFLGACIEEARADEHFKVASIAIAADHIDPLAVVESIYEADAFHYYSECAAKETAVAGIEAVLTESFSGANRFAAAKVFTEEVLEHTIGAGDFSLPFAGPHFFAGFTFFDEPESAGAPFAPGTLFLPRFQVARERGVYSAVTNLVVQPGDEPEALAAQLWGAYERFLSFDYSAAAFPKGEALCCKAKEVGPIGAYEKAAQGAVEEIRAGTFQKVVLARALDVEAADPSLLHPLATLYALRETFPNCYAFSFSTGNRQAFMGATPERLLTVAGDCLRTEALAGTIRRGDSAREDAQLEKALLSSLKDGHEHQLIIDYICTQLKSLGMTPEAEAKRLLRLHNVQHLLSPIRASIPEGLHALDVLKVLHPTPAVGGMPLEVVKPYIQKVEPFDRGLYAGTLGWLNASGDAEMLVGIRSALVGEGRVRLYAGAGIVEDSVPALEKEETSLKFKALGDVLGVSLENLLPV